MSSVKILLVDDEPDFLDFVGKRLRLRGFDVSGVQSGREALAVMSHSDYDVVLLDVKMPEMDGIQTLAEIKRLTPKTEVIILTGHANMEAAVQGMELGAFDYLIKPVEISELIFRIQEASGKSRPYPGKRNIL